MNDQPLISVIIPTFNRCSILQRAVLSATAQSYENLEVIVVSDGSTDSTSELMATFKDRRIRYIQHEKNKGLSATRNTGIGNATGEFITFLDDDDEWHPEKTAKQLKAFEKHPAGLVFTNGYSEYNNSSFIGEGARSGIIYDPGRDSFFPLKALIPPPSSWMISRKVLLEIGRFDETMRNHWDDGDYLVRLAQKYPIYFLNETLVTWHALNNHLETISPSLIRDKETFLRKNYSLMKKDREYFFRFHKALGKDAARIDGSKARHYLYKALLMKPYDVSILGKLLKTTGVF